MRVLHAMSVNGWSEEGTPRLICVDPPGGTSNSMVPNVFLGMPWPSPQPASPAMPTVSIGTADFSIEFWARQKYGGSPGSDEQFWTGLMINDPDAPSSNFPEMAAAIRWTDSDLSNQLWFCQDPGNGTILKITSGILATRRGVWNHYCLNFDRDGNMSCFIDNEAKGTPAAISTQQSSIGAQQVHALTSDHAFPIHAASIDVDAATYSIFPVIIGPFAVHLQLMTAAQRELSYRYKTVQSFGASVTKILFGWRDFTGQTAWDMNADHAAFGHLVGQSVPLGSPLGTNATVKVLDLSGNVNHWTIPTETDYTTRTESVFTDENGTFAVAFGADPFFT